MIEIPSDLPSFGLLRYTPAVELALMTQRRGACLHEEVNQDTAAPPLEKGRLYACGAREVLELLDDGFEIRVTCPKPACEPIPTALRNCLTVGDDVELTDLARCNCRVDAEPLLNEGRETRGLPLVALSCRAVDDLDLHCVLQSLLFSNFRAATQSPGRRVGFHDHS